MSRLLASLEGRFKTYPSDLIPHSPLFHSQICMKDHKKKKKIGVDIY